MLVRNAPSCLRKALRPFVFGGATLSFLMWVPVALAEPTVVVQVRRAGAPAEATVSLRDANGVITGSCRTTQGTCRIERVAPGRHYVWARDDSGRESVERQVMLPPDGEVTLVVAAP
jgi:hypothetical protein